MFALNYAPRIISASLTRISACTLAIRLCSVSFSALTRLKCTVHFEHLPYQCPGLSSLCDCFSILFGHSLKIACMSMSLLQLFLRLALEWWTLQAYRLLGNYRRATQLGVPLVACWPYKSLRIALQTTLNSLSSTFLSILRPSPDTEVFSGLSPKSVPSYPFDGNSLIHRQGHAISFIKNAQALVAYGKCDRVYACRR